MRNGGTGLGTAYRGAAGEELSCGRTRCRRGVEVPPGRVSDHRGRIASVDGLGRQQSRDASYRCTVGAQLQGGGDENQQSF
jgi:hypothetical protein